MPDKTPRRPRRPLKQEKPMKVTLIEWVGDDISPEEERKQQEALRWFRARVLERLALRNAEARLKHAACSHPLADWGTCPLTLAEREARQPAAHPHNPHYRVELQYHPAERLHSASVSLGKTDHHLYTTPKRSTKREGRDLALAWLREHDTTQREEPTP